MTSTLPNGNATFIATASVAQLGPGATFTYPTDVLTTGGTGYSSQVTQKAMTVIYTMDTKRNTLPTGYL